jgi:hypothetical protein
MDDIGNDKTRRANVQLLQHLLQGKPDVCDGNPMLTELLPGSGPCVVMFPEYAFGSQDWGTLNAFFNAVCRPLVLLAGFGATRGNVIKGWISPPASSIAGPQCFEESNGIAISSRYNGAWCWVHIPGKGTTCYCFLKMFPEQTTECVAIPDLALGAIQLALEFDDLVIAPGICADLLCDQPDNWRRSINRHLTQHSLGQTKSVLFGGLLYQQPPGHSLWQNAIDSMLGNNVARPDFSPVVALVNHAVGIPTWDETSDCWRSQSGVFSSSNIFMSQEHLGHVRKVRDRHFLGILVRRNDPCAVGGKVRWSSGSTTGKFLWHAGHSCNIDSESGAFSGIVTNTGADYECERLLMRLALPKASTGPTAAAVLVEERTSLQHFVAQLKVGPHLITSLLQGTGIVDPAGLPSSKELCIWLKDNHRKDKLSRGLVGLLFLRQTGIGNWTDEVAPGLMHGDLGGKHVHTLVWSSVDLTGPQMMRNIDRWVSDFPVAPVLLVIGQAKSGTLRIGWVQPERRSNVTENDDRSSSRSVSFAEVTNIRRAYLIPLEDVENYYPWHEEHSNDLQSHIIGVLAR